MAERPGHRVQGLSHSKTTCLLVSLSRESYLGKKKCNSSHGNAASVVLTFIRIAGLI